MVEKVKIEGLQQVRRALKRLPKEVRDKELDKALFAGAKIIRNDAKARAPSSGESFTRRLRGKTWTKKANNLKDSIAVRKEKKKFLRDSARRRIGVLHSKRDPSVGAWYWRYVEFGTRKMSARPFLVPAFESMKYVANNEIIRRLREGVFKQAAKVRGR